MEQRIKSAARRAPGRRGQTTGRIQQTLEKCREEETGKIKLSKNKCLLEVTQGKRDPIKNKNKANAEMENVS